MANHSGNDKAVEVREVDALQIPKRPQHKISFEEYWHYATLTRIDETRANEEYIRSKGASRNLGFLRDPFRRKKRTSHATDQTSAIAAARNATEKVVAPPSSGSRYPISDAEWKNASRAVRTAGWGSVFYLITTDVLGPFQTPWAFAQMGYGPSIALYAVFGILSAYSGLLLWKMFLGLDSDRYPVRNYADLFFRLYGPTAGYLVHIAQAIQLLVVIAFLILLNGQALSQISQGPPDSDGGTAAGLCFVVCVLIFAIAGCLVGQVRTLERFSWMASIAVCLNLLTIFMVMGLVAHYPPNFSAVTAAFGPSFVEGPILTFGGVPPDGLATGGSGFVAVLNGVNQAVLAYGGAMLFVSFLAELRHPLDFWKGLLCAEAFICAVYLVFGAYAYHFQGQFTFIPVQQGVSDYAWQTALNAMVLVASLVATGLYSNIGLKIAYVELLQRACGFPPLTSRRGRLCWAALMPVYWAVGFVLAAAIPQLALVSGLVGAVFGLGFSYILPALAALSFFVRRDAVKDDGTERFDEVAERYTYVDEGGARLWRGFKRRPWLHAWHAIYFLGSLATCALGCYTSIIQLMAAFESGVATSFTCKSPV